ncbi:MAG: DUF4332 domain-containing protein [Rubripirellula sp.]
MNPLIAFLRAAHCSNTHHYFAVDALPLVQTDAGRRLAKLLVRHHHRYLLGTIDPDIRFRDYQNHVIHVTDGYWGGAPRVAHKWYDRMQRYLREDRFSDAAHAAGVLSHYFTDPLHPLHTQQCARERVLHRPIEWSINQAYTQIYQDWQQDGHRVVFQLSDRPGWLGEAILHGARFANQKYDQLLDEYDLPNALHQSRVGLNSHLRASLSEMIGLAVTGWARVLERAAFDAEATRRQALPRPSSIASSASAVSFAPLRVWSRSIERREERREVSKLVEEFSETGTLRKHLPHDVDIVHRVVKVHEDEKRWKQQRQRRLASKRTVIAVEPNSPASGEEPVILPFQPLDETPEVPDRVPAVALADPLTVLPSIGAKTAIRLGELGIDNVGLLVSTQPESIASGLQIYWITEATVSRWQSEARLLSEIIDIQPRDAQLLAAAGVGNAASLRKCSVENLQQRISQFATTAQGRRCLGGQSLPRLVEVERWITAANHSDGVRTPRKRSA